MKRILPLLFLGLLTCNFINADISLPFLVAYFPFDNDVNDFSGNGNNGTADKVDFRSGGTGTIGVFGKTSSVSVPDNKTFDFSSATGVTIAVRVKQESRTNGYILVKMGPGGRIDDEYSLALTDDGHVTGGFIQSSSIYKEVTSNGILVLDTWYDIILIWKKSGEISLYIDGDLDTLTTSSVTSIQNTSFPLISGDPDTISSNSIVGSMEDIYIYNRALTSSDIAEFSIYHKPTGLSPNSIEEDCILYPNPVKDVLNISTALNFRNSKYRITDMGGKLLLSGFLSTEYFRLNLSFFKPGLYNIQIDNGTKTISKKILKQ
jgi:hypothetical protein